MRRIRNDKVRRSVLMLAIGCEQNTTPDTAQATQEQAGPTVETSGPIDAAEATPDIEQNDGLTLGTKVIGIIDGDTIVVLVDGKETKRRVPIAFLPAVNINWNSGNHELCFSDWQLWSKDGWEKL